VLHIDLRKNDQHNSKDTNQETKHSVYKDHYTLL